MIRTYGGNSAYCYANSLHMCLEYAGMAPLPDVGLLECMTGMPFGATFLRRDRPLFFPSPSGMDPDRGLTQALDTLGWTCDVCRFREAEEAAGALREALLNGPVLIGPLDPATLPYDPNQSLRRRGGDHFVVALRMDGEVVQVHDPQLYPFATLPLAELMKTWNAEHIGYAQARYTFRCRFRAERLVAEADMLAATVGTALRLMTSVAAGPVLYGGTEAYARAAAVLRGEAPEAFTAPLPRFVLPLGARRCLDAGHFFETIRATEAAHLMVSKAETYGAAQYYAARGDWDRTADSLNRLAGIDSECVATLHALAQ